VGAHDDTAKGRYGWGKRLIFVLWCRRDGQTDYRCPGGTDAFRRDASFRRNAENAVDS
jgi:hypothetical protein